MPKTLDQPYAVIKTGGKQYRVTEGQTLLVEKLAGDAGATIDLETLLVAGNGDPQLEGGKVQAKVVGHEKGPKLRVFKFKPKRGYKKRTGHRQQLTRIEVTSIGGAKKAAQSTRPAKPKAEPKPKAEEATE